MQRVRIGLTGLAAVFLLVVLAAAFFGLMSHESTVKTDASGRVVEVNAAAAAGNALEAAQPKEPLAELGVTPGGAAPATNQAALPSP